MPNISLRSGVNQKKFKISSITFRKEEPWKKYQDKSRNRWVNSNWFHRNYMGNYGKDMYDELDMADSGRYYQGPGMYENPNPNIPGYNYGGY